MTGDQEYFRRIRFQAVVSDLLDAHEAGAPAGQLVDMLMDAAPLLAPSTKVVRDWTSPRTRQPRMSRRKPAYDRGGTFPLLRVGSRDRPGEAPMLNRDDRQG
jgi:hypothetical protein